MPQLKMFDVRKTVTTEFLYEVAAEDEDTALAKIKGTDAVTWASSMVVTTWEPVSETTWEVYEQDA